MATLADIEKGSKNLAASRDALADLLQSLDAEISKIKAKYMWRIKKAVASMVEHKAILKAAVEVSPELFNQPRTIIMNGVEVGFNKGKGKISWTNEAHVIKKIHELFPDQAAVLIKKTEKPVKKAIARLQAADLKKIGITVSGTDDAVVIRFVDSEVSKLIDAFLKESEGETEDIEEAA